MVGSGFEAMHSKTRRSGAASPTRRLEAIRAAHRTGRGEWYAVIELARATRDYPYVGTCARAGAAAGGVDLIPLPLRPVHETNQRRPERQSHDVGHHIDARRLIPSRAMPAHATSGMEVSDAILAASRRCFRGAARGDDAHDRYDQGAAAECQQQRPRVTSATGGRVDRSRLCGLPRVSLAA